MKPPNRPPGARIMSGLALAAALAATTPSARANVYATDIKLNGTAANTTLAERAQFNKIRNADAAVVADLPDRLRFDQVLMMLRAQFAGFGKLFSKCCDHGDLAANQFGRQRGQPIELTLRPAVLDSYVLAFIEALAKSAETIP